jgi:hypothetical protein
VPKIELGRLSETLWKAWGQGLVGDDEAQSLAEMIEARRALLAVQKPIQRHFGSRPRSPASMERRRRWAASGALPPALASRFTLAEQAVLAVVAAEHRKCGDCRLTNKETADVAGVCITTVKNALRVGRVLNILSIEDRRLTAFRNAPNVVRIVSPEWRAWLRLEGGGKSVPRSPTPYKNQRLRTSEPTWTARGQGVRRGAAQRDSERHGREPG